MHESIPPSLLVRRRQSEGLSLEDVHQFTRERLEGSDEAMPPLSSWLAVVHGDSHGNARGHGGGAPIV